MNIKQNVGKMDSGIRYLVGFGLLFAVFLIEGPWRWAGLIGILPIATAVVKTCPAYWLFGIDTEAGSHGPPSKAL